MSLDLAEVDAGRRADVAIDHMRADKAAWQRRMRRPPSLSYRDALVALKADSLFLWLCTANQRAGLELTDDDFTAMTRACRRIEIIVDEVIR